MVNFYCRFVPSLSTMLHPLHCLLKKGTVWLWSAECQSAFDSVKDALTSSPILTHYQNDLPVVLEVDASPCGIGGCLFHIDEQGEKKPIYFVSRALTAAEKNYSQIDREGLAIVFSIKRLHQFLYGRHFVLRTDHKPLLRILGANVGIGSTVAARLQRWAVFLASYDYSIEHVKGTDNVTADCLSRLPQPLSAEQESVLIHAMNEFTADPCGDIPLSAPEVAKATQGDEVLSDVMRFLRFGWPSDVAERFVPYSRIRDELSIEQGCLLWKSRVIIPSTFRQALLRELHSVHLGVNRMKSVARSFFYWPKLDSDIADLCASCELCQQFARAPSKEATHPWVYPSRAFERVHIDFAEFEHRFFFVVVDAYSKWVEVFDMGRDSTTSKTISCLMKLISHFGIPKFIVSDNGPQFTSHEFASFCSQNGIIHKLTPPYHPASNGQAERIVQELKKSLKTRPPTVSIAAQLCRFLFAYRTTPHSTTRVSPADLVLRFTPTSRFSMLQPSFGDTMRQPTMSSGPPSRGFVSGDRVWFLNPVPRGGPKWLKGVVLKRFGPLTYSVEYDGRQRTIHVEHLRACQSDGTSVCVDTFPSTSPQVPDTAPVPVLPPQQPSSPVLPVPSSQPTSPVAVSSPQPSLPSSSTAVPSPASPAASPCPPLRRSGRERAAPKRLIEEM
eukprot:scpid44158/ scgid13167/ Uncharacterized protein K02A2.6